MQWVDILGYAHQYQINEDGEVRWFKDGVPTTIRPYTAGQNRARITMRRADRTKVSVAIVDLMADAFMGGRIAGYNIVHKNGCKYDNRLSNLAFATKKETAEMSARNRRKPVLKMLYDGTVVEIYPSAASAARANYISTTMMNSLCNGKLEKSCRADGYYYRYEDKERGQHG